MSVSAAAEPPLSFSILSKKNRETGLGPFQWALIRDQGSFGLSILLQRGRKGQGCAELGGSWAGADHIVKQLSCHTSVDAPDAQTDTQGFKMLRSW